MCPNTQPDLTQSQSSASIVEAQQLCQTQTQPVQTQPQPQAEPSLRNMLLTLMVQDANTEAIKERAAVAKAEAAAAEAAANAAASGKQKGGTKTGKRQTDMCDRYKFWGDLALADIMDCLRTFEPTVFSVPNMMSMKEDEIHAFMFKATSALPWALMDRIRVQDSAKAATWAEQNRFYRFRGRAFEKGYTEEERYQYLQEFEHERLLAESNPESDFHEYKKRKYQKSAPATKKPEVSKAHQLC